MVTGALNFLLFWAKSPAFDEYTLSEINKNKYTPLKKM